MGILEIQIKDYNLLKRFILIHRQILLLEYRGCGLSRGKPSEKGLYLDAKAAIDYAFSRDDLDKSKINLFGENIGAAVAINAGL